MKDETLTQIRKLVEKSVRRIQNLSLEDYAERQRDREKYEYESLLRRHKINTAPNPHRNERYIG